MTVAKKNNPILLLLMLFGCFGAVKSQALFDQFKYERLIDTPVKAITFSSNGTLWAVAGDHAQKIICIKANHTLREFNLADKYPNLQFTSLFAIGNGYVLAGTKEHYLFYLTENKAVQIGQHNGLRDSSIVKIVFDQNLKKTELITPTHTYILENVTSPTRIWANLKKKHPSALKSFLSFGRYKIRKPIQKKICNIASEFDYSRRPKKYIGHPEIDSILTLIRPGDILLKRDNYFLSNVGIEGFWTHSGIFIGSLEELDRMFASISIVGNKMPSEYIKTYHPILYKKLLGKKDLIIEAIGKGVTINSIEHIALVDFLSVLRPNLSAEDIFKSMLISFEYLGYPYDFMFEFEGDQEVVCSELIYNSFRPRSDKSGLTFLFSTVMGRAFMSPNDMAHQYALERNSANPTFSFVLYCDGDEKIHKSFFNNENAFANSWKRKGK